MRLGIIAAQDEEMKYLEDLIIHSSKELDYEIVHLTVSGVGMLNAMYATTKLLQPPYMCDMILNIGVVAGRGDLRVGDIVSIDRVYNADFDLSVFGHEKYYMPKVGNSILSSKHVIGLQPFTCFSTSRFSGGNIDTDIKDYVVDMEYYGIAYACAVAHIPFASIKIVSDTDLVDNHLQYESNLEECSKRLATHLYENLLVPYHI